MQNRRNFIKQSLLATGAVFAARSLTAATKVQDALPGGISKLSILHTNDVHSRLEPFPMDGGKYQGLGGVEARMSLIESIRKSEQKVLLLDAGDIFQGTPFFNIYKGEPEIKAMSIMGYDAATMGNHDFDAGLENFATQLKHASFPIVICNYDFTGTPMEFKTLPYTIIKKGNLKLGITGVGIELDGLVAANLYGNTRYLDPVEKVNTVAHQLKQKEGCDMVICLSHLGYEYKNNKISDQVLAKETDNIDLILGGHTHTFMDAPAAFTNKSGSDVFVNQVGWAGIVLGRLDFEFGRFKKKNLTKAHTVVISKKTRE